MSGLDNLVESDQQLWEAFTNASISKEDWTHRAHVRVAFMHLQRLPFEETLVILRTRIKKLNQQHGTPEAVDRGYHETITHAFLHLIAAARARSDCDCSHEFCEQHVELLDKRILLKYYSRNRIMSAQAKGSFLAPDIQPLPEMAD